MSWRAITETDVLAVLNGTESTALRGALLASGQTDPLPDLIDQVTNHVRDSIRSCRDNVLDPTDGTVPEACIPAAVDMIVYRLSQRLGRALPVTDDRREAMKSAEKYFERVASCKMAVEQFGADPDTTARTVGPRITGRTRNFTRTTQDGI